jgi:signal transduction histidine kinase
LLFGVASAHGSDDAPTSSIKVAQTTTTSTDTTADQENEQEIQTTAKDTAALKARLEARKAQLKTTLTALEQAKIKTKCATAQGKLSSVRGRIKGIETSRAQVYDNLVDRLTSLSTKLSDKGLDTSELDSEITELNAKIATFQTDLATYKQTVTDLAAMDCKSDPTAFKASLEAARTAQAKVKEDATAIKTYVNDTIKATLKDIRSQLEQQSDENEGTTN